MGERHTGQVDEAAAEIYERFFVPALFGGWTLPMLEAAALDPADERVLDVACGTGVLARAAADRLGRPGRVIGLDPNEGMLAVARRRAPAIGWRAGRAESLPWEDAAFDVVFCQFGLMFFEDRQAGLRQMHRVLRPGGRLAVAVWDGLDAIPAFAKLVELLERICGSAPADALRTPFSLGDRELLARLCRQAGIEHARLEAQPGHASFPSLRDWIHTNVRGWAFSALVDDAQLEALIGAAEREMGCFVTPGGTVAFDTSAWIVSASK